MIGILYYFQIDAIIVPSDSIDLQSSYFLNYSNYLEINNRSKIMETILSFYPSFIAIFLIATHSISYEVGTNAMFDFRIYIIKIKNILCLQKYFILNVTFIASLNLIPSVNELMDIIV